MTAEQPPNTTPRYRGLRGAVATFLLIAGIFVALGVAAAAVILWRSPKLTDPALMLLVAAVRFGVLMGFCYGASRWLCGWEGDKLLTFRVNSPGELGGLGFFVGWLVAGSLSEAQLRRAAAAERRPAVGEVVRIAGPTLDGKAFDIQDHRGKVVLVDFWATWCPPCVAELPNVRAAFDEYHARGFEVVAVSLDRSRDDLDAFLAKHPEPWPQLFFDKDGQRGFDNPLARSYGIDSIPRLWVIDREGKVAAVDVRGQEIKAAVGEALGVPPPWSDRAAAALHRAFLWTIIGFVEAPWYTLAACCVAATAVAVAIEFGVRRTVKRAAGLTPAG